MTGTEVVLVAVVVAMAAGVQTVTGFGFALLAVPFMSLVVPPETAVVIAATLGVLTSSGQAWAERAHADRRTVAWMLGGAAVGAPFGFLVLVVTTERQLRLVLVGVIVTFLAVDLLGRRPSRASRGVDAAAGAVSGALNTALATNGPPLVMALHARHLPPPRFRGTLTAVLAGSGVLTVALFALGGRYDADIWWALAAALPGLGLGFGLGLRHRGRVGPERFRQVVTVLLAVTATVALVGVVRA
ncbi:sulfite exporter TauE/SafE family protein [Rhabdothermincola salaria]|uniref:sulfite exporter TauE/SafE family protein n=1 Tax=Rhabdothermincola salaria TaxID=2903142 RepID=UPI001E60068E|nr:sulfite exporter TauE/SafE family protein [Rhabdothermincola salaria]